jgi:hypothetical protein
MIIFQTCHRENINKAWNPYVPFICPGLITILISSILPFVIISLWLKLDNTGFWDRDGELYIEKEN